MDRNALGMHVLITGMPGTGKSSLVLELRKRGYVAYDADDGGFSSRCRTVAGAGGPSRSPIFSAGRSALVLCRLL